MYLNVISFKNSKTLAFKSEIPFSLNELVNDWTVVTDEENGQVLTFKNSEVTTIANAKVDPDIKAKPKRGITINK